ncbi:hypothetical protein [Proteiniborus sp. MB09-C3]|uniref:hypothetical protein n=1 Tax=Proteiniborus sp. MB09-C3 TaxID=3050072 RepID=UPI0025561C38|nr:hypothetical protein [Proteiniborus sp. MB09-C3]WIV13134.1 hypothetical protein QO263_05340 [Proteiniborus sp. MB09-C3]
MKRILFSTASKCLSGCSYCFAQWESYDSQPLFIESNGQEDYEIIYPCCDGEFFKDSENIEGLEHYVFNKNSPIIISFSTKNDISNLTLKRISKLNERLVAQNKGFIKISTSITNISMISELEPFTISYIKRIELLKKIYENGIPTSLVLKPILPFICEEEYHKIIDDSLKYTRLILIGDLYVNKNTDFYDKYVRHYSYEQRLVNWLDSRPVWNVIESSKIKHNLISYIESKSALSFENDIDLLKYIHNVQILNQEGA